MIEIIEGAKAEIAAGREAKTTARKLLEAVGAKRRRATAVEKIRSALHEAGLQTDPDFVSVWVDAEIAFVPEKQEAPRTEGEAPAPKPQTNDAVIMPAGEPKEAMQLIRMLNAANRGVLSVNPQASIEQAITLMLTNDYSQLPVMSGSRDLKGVVSWKSIGGRLAQRATLTTVSDAMEAGVIVKETASIFEATSLIIAHEFIFVASVPDNRIIGIVTATDLSEQFQRLSEPFLLIGQIENQIRNMMHGRFDLETLREACNDNDPERKERIIGIADLTFGEYIRILEKEANWKRFGYVVDRAIFIKEIDKVRDIRNDVMHFDPDGIDDDEYVQLRKFSKFLTRLETLSGR